MIVFSSYSRGEEQLTHVQTVLISPSRVKPAFLVETIDGLDHSLENVQLCVISHFLHLIILGSMNETFM